MRARRMPALLTRPAEPERDRAALAALALWAGRYGPARNVEGDDGLWIDMTGVAHLFGGEARLLDDLVARLGRAGLTARAGLADTPGAAFALARFAATPSAPWRIAAPGTARDALAALPVEALRLPRRLRRPAAAARPQPHRPALRSAARGPRPALPQRAANARAKPGGKRERQAALMAGIVLARLDQALGLAPGAAHSRWRSRRCILHGRCSPNRWSPATGVAAALEALAHDLGRLLDSARRRRHPLRPRPLSRRRIGPAGRTSAPAVRAAMRRHLIALLAEKLDTLDAGFGIDAMTLACDHAEPLDAHQITLAGAGADRAATETAALLDRLSNRLGAARVFRLARADSHHPRARPAARVRPGSQAARMDRPGLAPAYDQPARRPAFLLPAPEPIAVLAEVPEGPPLRFTWRRLTRRIARYAGPRAHRAGMVARDRPPASRARPPARAAISTARATTTASRTSRADATGCSAPASTAARRRRSTRRCGAGRDQRRGAAARLVHARGVRLREMNMTVQFDTLSFAKRLTAAGEKIEIAEAHAMAFKDFVMDVIATKADVSAVSTEVEKVRTDLSAEIGKVRTDLSRRDRRSAHRAEVRHRRQRGEAARRDGSDAWRDGRDAQ